MDAIERGNLAQKAVLPLLADLYQQDATGSLRLERAPLQKAVYFRDGQILFAASNDPKDQLASILVEEGKLSPDQMQVARARVSAGNPLAKVLTELGYISQRELADAARLKVEKILTDLFTWKEGTYQFAEKSLPKGAIDLELSTQRLLFNSIRRIEDRTWILEEVGSLETVLSPTESLNVFIAEAEPDDKALKVVRAVDGTRTIKQISDSSDLGDFEVSKIVVAALTIGAFRKGAAEPETEAISIPADEEAFSVEAADVISFQVSDPGDEEEPLEQTIVEADAAPFSFSQEEPEALSAPPELEAPLTAPETLPPLVPSVSQPPLVPPVSQPPLVSPELEARPVSPEPQPPLVFPESQPPLISPEPPPPFESSSVSGLLIDEPEPDAAEQAPQRTPPRPRQAGRGAGGGAGKKVLAGLAAILLLVGGSLAGYFFIWPMFSSDETTGGTETPSSQTPVSPSPQQQPPATTAGTGQSPPPAAPGTAGTSGSAPGPTPTAPAPGRPGQSQPTSPGGPQTPALPTTPTTPPPRPGSTGPSPTTPPSTAKPPTRPTPSPTPPPPQPSPAPSPPTSGSSTNSQELLKNGQYPEAARSYLQQLRGVGNNKFTIAVGMYCDVANVGRAFRDSGNSSSLIVLPYQYQGRSCYRVFWGLYDSQEAARQNLTSVPAAIRSPQSVPVPTSRLTR